MMRALGELLLSNLEYKSFIDFSADLLGPWAGFFMGWTYWMCWIVTGIVEVVAIGSYMHFWFPHIPPWLTSLGCVLLLLILNQAVVQVFGEMEFWFALIKIIAIILLIVTGIGLIATHHMDTHGASASLSHLWDKGGLFPKGLSGFFAAFQLAIFSFVGLELVGTMAAETKDPKTVLPRAINAIPFRLATFYVLSLIVIMCVSPWNIIDPNRSPFVTTFMLAGLPMAASLVNFVVLTSATSSINSGVFSSGRMLFGLARQDDAPAVFGMLNRRAVPGYGLIFSCICLLGGVILLYAIPNLMTAFTLASTVSAILFMFVWIMIFSSYLVYRRKRPHCHAQSVYKMPLGRVFPWIGIAFFIFVLALLTLQQDTRDALLATPLWFAGLAIAYRLRIRVRHKNIAAAIAQ
jgi:D-serine/D-alanine/glycine transporter